MKLRAAAVAAAFAVGFGVGTATGRRHARQLARLAGRAGRSAPVAGTATFVGDKTTAAARLTVEWLKDVAGSTLGWRNGDEAADAIVIDLAEELAYAINGHTHNAAGGPFRPSGMSARQVRVATGTPDSQGVRTHEAPPAQSSSR
jgi:hypothetical protein